MSRSVSDCKEAFKAASLPRRLLFVMVIELPHLADFSLTQQIVPLTEKHLGSIPKFRGIAGYSLAGLFALWSVYQIYLFDRAASVSGPLWLDGFLEFMQANTPKAKFVYLSLGGREKASKNSLLS